MRRGGSISLIKSAAWLAVLPAVIIAASCGAPVQKPSENASFSFIINSDTVGAQFGPAQYQMGLAYVKEKQYQEALKAFSAAIKNGYAGCDVYLSRAGAYSALGLYSGAIGDASICLDAQPRLATAYSTRGYAYLKSGEYAKAVSDYSQALNIDASNTEAYFNRALAFRELAQFDMAVSDLQRAINLDPGYLEAIIWLGRTYYSTADYTSAIEQFTYAINMDPVAGAVAYNDRAVCLGTEGDLGGALRDLNILIGLNPSYYKAFYNRGVVYMKMVQPAPAIEELDTYLCLDVNDKYGCRNLAMGWRGYYPTFFICCYDPSISQRAMAKCNSILAVARSAGELPYSDGALYFQSEGPSTNY